MCIYIYTLCRQNRWIGRWIQRERERERERQTDRKRDAATPMILRKWLHLLDVLSQIL